MENDKRVRIADIAEELGVSTATVSNVIHGKTKKISDRTVQRVSELLEERQYIPSMAGILLAQNDSRIIGIVINDHEKYESHALEDVFIAASLNCLSAEIEKSGFFMMVKVTEDINEIVRFASMWNMEGLILMGFCRQDYKKLRGLMRIPFVVYEVNSPMTVIFRKRGGYAILPSTIMTAVSRWEIILKAWGIKRFSALRTMIFVWTDKGVWGFWRQWEKRISGWCP